MFDFNRLPVYARQLSSTISINLLTIDLDELNQSHLFIEITEIYFDTSHTSE